MGRVVEAKKGDCVISIAKAAGFADWKTVWNHKDNDGLRGKRDDPSVLHPGDKVYLPDFKSMTMTLKAGRKYKIKTKQLKASVQLFLNDPAGTPYADKQWELTVGERLYKGKTDAKGFLAQDVSAEAREGNLTLFLDEKCEKKLEWIVDIGSLEPIDTVGGVQARLNNLGYHTGDDEPGTLGPGTKNALSDFQNDHELPVTGEIDEATRSRLKDEHKS